MVFPCKGLEAIDPSPAPPGIVATPKPAVAVAALISLSACGDPCNHTVVTRTVAPDGRRSAVMFQRDCGATTGFSTQISIVEPGAASSGAGNVFRADDDHGAASAGTWGGSWAEMQWLAPNHPLIRYAERSRIFAQESEMPGVHISYQLVRR